MTETFANTLFYRAYTYLKLKYPQRFEKGNVEKSSQEAIKNRKGIFSSEKGFKHDSHEDIRVPSHLRHDQDVPKPRDPNDPFSDVPPDGPGGRQ